MSEFTTDTVCALAREAGAGLSCVAEPLEHPWKFSQAELERFAALVAAKERERFALECIDLVAFHGGSVELEAAIRARGQKEGA